MTCRHHISMILMFKCRTAKVNELNSTRLWYILEVGAIFRRSQHELHNRQGGEKDKLQKAEKSENDHNLDDMPVQKQRMCFFFHKEGNNSNILMLYIF